MRHFSWMMEGLMDGELATTYFTNYAFEKVTLVYNYVVKQKQNGWTDASWVNVYVPDKPDPSFADRLLCSLSYINNYFKADAFVKENTTMLTSEEIAKNPRSTPVPSVKLSGKYLTHSI